MESQISELFTRCPKCRSFSIRSLNSFENQSEKSKTSIKNKLFCDNCSYTFSSKSEKNIPIIENDIPVIEKSIPVEKTGNHRRYITFTVISIVLTITLFAFVLNQKKTKNMKDDNLKNEINSEQVVNIDDKKESDTANRSDTFNTNNLNTNKLDQTEVVQNTVGADHRVRPDIGQNNEKGQAQWPAPTNRIKSLSVITKKQKDLSESKIPDTINSLKKDNNIDKDKTQKIETMPKLINRTSIKAIKLNYLRVRTSHPLESDPSFRWKFKTETITIRREKNQKVYIAGNSSGTKKWMVDDAIYINGRKFQGWEIESENIGVIPHENRRKPLDITNMVPPEKNIDLKIDLIDYGKFWGNTSIYIVVK